MTKKRSSYIFFVILIFTLFCGCCATSAIPINPSSFINNIFDTGELSRVYRFELPSNSTDQQIVSILTKRYLNSYLIGTLDWYRWISAYRIDNIELADAEDDNKTAVIDVDVRPVFHDSWEMINYSSDLPNGWIHIWWFTEFEDKRFYYELNGWYSGG